MSATRWVLSVHLEHTQRQTHVASYVSCWMSTTVVEETPVRRIPAPVPCTTTAAPLKCARKWISLESHSNSATRLGTNHLLKFCDARTIQVAITRLIQSYSLTVV